MFEPVVFIQFSDSLYHDMILSFFACPIPHSLVPVVAEAKKQRKKKKGTATSYFTATFCHSAVRAFPLTVLLYRTLRESSSLASSHSRRSVIFLFVFVWFDCGCRCRCSCELKEPQISPNQSCRIPYSLQLIQRSSKIQ